MGNSMTMIGVAGASGAGKSYFSHELFNRLQQSDLAGQVRLIHEDSYYKDQSHLKFEQREETNYDHPEAFEHDLLVRHVQAFADKQAFDAPIYDYATHNRSSKTETVQPGSILIIEGILVLHYPQLRNRLDIKLFVDVPLDICLARRIRRDVANRGRDVLSILDQFEQTVRPMYRQHIEPCRQFADLIVPGGGENGMALQLVLDHIQVRHQ